MWGMFIAGGVIYTLQNIQENTQRYLQMKTRTEVVAERNANKGNIMKFRTNYIGFQKILK